MLELLAGVVVAFVAVVLVLQPLFSPRAAAQAAAEVSAEVEFVELEESESPKIQALLALREIEFDRATGKLSDEDYEELKAKYAGVALEAIKQEEAEPTGDEAEELIRKVAAGTTAVCSSCGPRPEDDAAFCSKCGRPLAAQDAAAGASARQFCSGCGATLEADARFCSACGTKVAAEVGA
ncbi:MAG: zinc ribbon domain-containing protein [Gemmatimonadales bacterium]|jgi:hypothetical protein